VRDPTGAAAHVLHSAKVGSGRSTRPGDRRRRLNFFTVVPV